MKIYRLKGLIVKEPMDTGFPPRERCVVICKDNESLQDAICRRFNVEKIFKFNLDLIEIVKDFHSVEVKELSVGDLLDIIHNEVNRNGCE